MVERARALIGVLRKKFDDGTLPNRHQIPKTLFKEEFVVTRKYPIIFFASLFLTTPAFCGSKITERDLIKALESPATWRALGSMSPGVEDGAAHDLYRNSAVIAAVVDSNKYVSFIKLTDDPAAAPQAFAEYYGRAVAGGKPSVDDKTCGVAVAHLYGAIFSKLLLANGPNWVRPDISPEEAKAVKIKSASDLKFERELLSDLCDGWKYRSLNDSFDSLLRNVQGEMPYLLNQGLRLGKENEDKLNQAKNMAVAKAAGVDKAHQRGKEMLAELQGVSPGISEDPFGRCIDIPNDTMSVLKNQCMNKLMVSVDNDHALAFQRYISAASADRVPALEAEQQKLTYSDYKKCEPYKVVGDGDQELMMRCLFVQIKKREGGFSSAPLQTDAQLAVSILGQAQAIASRYPQLASIPTQEKQSYVGLLVRAERLGSLDAKLKSAEFLSLFPDDLNGLELASKQLDDLERARGVTPQTQALRKTITEPLEALQLANSPTTRRKTMRESLGADADYAEKAALAMDGMASGGQSCDQIIVQTYSYAMNKSIPMDTRYEIVTDTFLGMGIRSGCITD